MQNKGSEPLRDVDAELSLPDGWTAEPVGSTTAEAVQPGEVATFTWRVKVQDDAK